MRAAMFLVLALATACHKKQTTTTVQWDLTDVSSYDLAGAEGPWAPAEGANLLPLGEWIRVGQQVAYTYVSAQQGPSAQWRDTTLHVRRLTHEPAGMQVLDDAEVQALGLPRIPDWLAGYGAQPPRGTRWGAWRDDPRFQARLHPDFPDDLKVAIGDVVNGQFHYEVVWASLRTCEAERCTAALLNQPHHVPLTLGDTLEVDLGSALGDGLPPAYPPGTSPSDELRSIAASPPAEFASFLDDPDWDVDDDIPMADRLLPMSTWVVVGGDLAFVNLAEQGPVAWIFHDDGTIASRPVFWATRGMRVLTPEERRDLPETPLKDPTGQPPSGPWGDWRLDPELQPFLNQGHPDVLNVHLLRLLGSPEQHVRAPIARVRIYERMENAYRARLIDDPGEGFTPGDIVQVLPDMEAGGLLVGMRVEP